MKFIKHFTDAHRGKSMLAIKKKLGMAGIGMYWTLVELCGEKLEKSREEEYSEAHCRFEFDAQYLANVLGTKPARIGEVLGTFREAGQIAHESSNDVIKIDFPKLLECLDRDSKRARTDRAVAAPKRKSKRKKEEKDKEIVSVSAESAKATAATWNQSVGSLPKVRDWSPDRAKAATNLLKKYTLGQWEEACGKTEASDFLSGRNGRWTSCSYDWLLNLKNFRKVIEGNYENRGGFSEVSTNIHAIDLDGDSRKASGQ